MLRRRVFWRGALWAGLAVGLPLLSLGALAQKERDDRFCVACHLHEEKFARFQATASRDLAGAHHGARSRVRCIDCHGGADVGMRLQVWAVAAADTVRFLVGHYREPDRMRLPLRDKECNHCHDPIVKPSPRQTLDDETPGTVSEPFHAIREHRSLKTPCVACHTSHTQGEKRFRFVDLKLVLPICRDCHSDLGVEG